MNLKILQMEKDFYKWFAFLLPSFLSLFLPSLFLSFFLQ